MRRIETIEANWGLDFVSNRLAVVHKWIETALRLET